jgi:hypothetical protein
VSTFIAFKDWDELCAHVRLHAGAFYQAPLDRLPHGVYAKVKADGTIRVFPPGPDADAFNADPGHLSRFKKRVETTCA